MITIFLLCTYFAGKLDNLVIYVDANLLVFADMFILICNYVSRYGFLFFIMKIAQNCPFFIIKDCLNYGLPSQNPIKIYFDFDETY